jgi:ribosomal peptide maturation radical SAM protein 1
MVDNIMPFNFFKTLIPRLGDEVPDLHMFYEQKANLSLDKVEALKNAGVAIIQPGIEALSTSLLERMDKGVKAKQNIALLRYSRSVELKVNWNLLYAFPGDKNREYIETIELLPLIRHLNPPSGLFHLSLDRFSPYFNQPEKYGITRKYPWPGFQEFIPEDADPMKLSYHFFGDYQSDSNENRDLMNEIMDDIAAWEALWSSDTSPRPSLAITPLSNTSFMLWDSRSLADTQEIQFMDWDQVKDILVEHPLSRRDDLRWAIDRKLFVEIDDRLVPLATAKPDLIRAAEAQRLSPFLAENPSGLAPSL